MELKRMVKYGDNRIAYISTNLYSNRHFAIVEMPPALVIISVFDCVNKAKEFAELIDSEELESNSEPPVFYYNENYRDLYTQFFMFLN